MLQLKSSRKRGVYYQTQCSSVIVSDEHLLDYIARLLCESVHPHLVWFANKLAIYMYCCIYSEKVIDRTKVVT